MFYQFSQRCCDPVSRDADSASCRVAELVSQELLQLLLTIDSIILSLNLVCSFFLSLCLSVFLSVCLSFSHCSSYFLSFSCFHKIIVPFMSYLHSSFLLGSNPEGQGVTKFFASYEQNFSKCSFLMEVRMITAC